MRAQMSGISGHEFIGLRINATDLRSNRTITVVNKMICGRACMIVKYNERSLKYFKALFADIFNQKRKRMHCLQTQKDSP